MIKHVTQKLKRFYQKNQLRIFSTLDRHQFSKEQINDFAMKVDIIGGAIVAQAIAWNAPSPIIQWLFIILAIFICAILWITTFIMKGYQE